MKSTIRGVAVAATAALAVTLAACSPTSSDDTKTSLTIGVTYIGVNYDPTNYAYVSGDNGETGYEALFSVEQSRGEVRPWLAEEVNLSDDGKTLSMKLHDNVSFVDGTKMTAEAVAEALTLTFASENFLFYGTMKQFDVKLQATGEYSLDLTTNRRMTLSFLGQLAGAAVASPDAVANPSVFEDGPVGTGPYLIDEIVPDVSATYRKNPEYWNPSAVEFDTVKFVVFSDNIAAVNALKAGQIDATAIDRSNAAEIEGAGFNIVTSPDFYALLVIMDNRGEIVPALGDVRVRQAIAMAFDREAIAETVDLGYGNPTSQAAIEGVPGYVPGGDDRWPYDLDEAKRLMAEAGYPDGFTIDVPIPTLPAGLNPQYQPQYEPIVQQSLADIGITVTFGPPDPDGSEWGASITAGSIPLVLFSNFPTNTLFYLEPQAPAPFGAMMNDETRALLEKFNTGATLEETNAAAEELGTYLLENAWYVPFSHALNLWATSDEVTMPEGWMQKHLLDFKRAQ